MLKLFSVIFGSANAMPAKDDSEEIIDSEVNANRVVIDNDEVRIPLNLLRRVNTLNDDPNIIDQFTSLWQQFMANFNLAEAASATTAAAWKFNLEFKPKHW